MLYGACDAVVHTPCGPFVDALEHLVRITDPVELRSALRDLAKLAAAVEQGVAADTPITTVHTPIATAAPDVAASPALR